MALGNSHLAIDGAEYSVRSVAVRRLFTA